MLSLLASIIKLLFSLTKSKNALACELAITRKELEILKRTIPRKKSTFILADKLFFITLNKAADIRRYLTILKPETILRWQRSLIASYWCRKHNQRKKGRPAVGENIRRLILEMKNDNLLWGVRKIQGELLKLGIRLDTKTIWKILLFYRRKGKLKTSLTWKKFLETQIGSIFAMDFFTVDTLGRQRFYVHFILAHRTREIIRFGITENPNREFVRQQLIELSDSVRRFIYLIHDNDVAFNLDFASFNIESARIAPASPNMNAIAERFVGSVRREVLDHFILFGKSQIQNILTEYVAYYNDQRPHQGLRQTIPKGCAVPTEGVIRKLPILGGLHHHYYRQAA